jgi:hypothetical protein
MFMTQNGGAITLDTVDYHIVALTGGPRVSRSGSSKRQHVPNAERRSPWEIEIGSSASYPRMHYGAHGTALVRAFKEVQLYA